MKKFYDSYGEGTVTKLKIFEEYIKNWIPNFINPKTSDKKVSIFDFFAGPGYDKNKNPGSPILILESVKYHKNNFRGSSLINITLNDKEREIYNKLKRNCEEYLNKYPEIKNLVNLKYYNDDFESLFHKIKDHIGKNPSLILLDQFGVKYLNVINEFENFDKIDFLLFLSSSYIRRFADTKEFKEILKLSKEDIEKIKNTPYKLIHDTIIRILKTRLEEDSKLQLYPFSFKKGSNIYGIIYGTKHISGAKKFLQIAWKINPDNGRADYDIYDDNVKKELTLFPKLIGKTTVEIFKEGLKEKILAGNITNNIDAFLYTIEKGFIPKHSQEVLKSLKRSDKIDYDSRSPLITYDNYNKGKKIRYVLKSSLQTIRRKTLLYETKVEYGNWTINHIVGCKHGCKFPCYAFMMAKKFGRVKDYEDWRKPKIVENALELLEKEIPKYKNKIDFVHLSFMTDPFMYDFNMKKLIPEIKDLTLKIIERLNKEGIRVTTLTKGIYPDEILNREKFLQSNEYGITLVSLNNEFKNKFEPFSAPYEARIASLKKLSDNGLRTWVSIEPYPTPQLDPQANNIERVLERISFVKKIIFGKLNYHRLSKYSNDYGRIWRNNNDFYKTMAQKVINFCEENNIKYHIKFGTPLSDNKTTNIFKE